MPMSKLPPGKKAHGTLCGVQCWVTASILHLINAIYVLFGAIVIGVAAGAVRAFKDDYKMHPKILVGVVVLGVFLVIEATLGIVGTMLGKQILLFIYMVLMALQGQLMFLVSIGAMLMGTERKNEVLLCGWNGMSAKAQRQIQDKLNCCGFIQKSDWRNQTMDHGYFKFEKFNGMDCKYTHKSNKAFDSCPTEAAGGCFSHYEESIEAMIDEGTTACLIFSFTTVLGIFTTMLYWRALGRDRKNSGNDDMLSESLNPDYLEDNEVELYTRPYIRAATADDEDA